MSFCTKCGNPLDPEALFCGVCGEKLIPDHQNNRNESFQRPADDIQVSKPFSATNLEFSMKNSQQRIVNLWLFLMAVFMFCIFLPSIIGLDGFDGGFAMSFIAGFMVIISLVVIFIYRSRARQLAKILKGDGRIAVWRYSQDEWVRFIAADFNDEKKTKKALFFIVAAIAVVVGILLTISLQDILALFIALGIIPIVALPAFLVPRARFNKLKNSEPKALISEKGVIVGKMFHLWVSLGASLDEVLLNKEEKPEMIEFTYSMPTRNGSDVQVARVPVPKGKLAEAEKIVSYFQSLKT